MQDQIEAVQLHAGYIGEHIGETITLADLARAAVIFTVVFPPPVCALDRSGSVRVYPETSAV